MALRVPGRGRKTKGDEKHEGKKATAEPPQAHREARARQIQIRYSMAGPGLSMQLHARGCLALCVCVVHWFLKGDPGRDTDFHSLLFDVLSGSPKS